MLQVIREGKMKLSRAIKIHENRDSLNFSMEDLVEAHLSLITAGYLKLGAKNDMLYGPNSGEDFLGRSLEGKFAGFIWPQLKARIQNHE